MSAALEFEVVLLEDGVDVLVFLTGGGRVDERDGPTAVLPVQASSAQSPAIPTASPSSQT